MQVELLTVDEVAKILKLSKQALYMMIHRREISHYKLSRRVRFSPAQIDQYLADKSIESNMQQARGIKDGKGRG